MQKWYECKSFTITVKAFKNFLLLLWSPIYTHKICCEIQQFDLRLILPKPQGVSSHCGCSWFLFNLCDVKWFFKSSKMIMPIKWAVDRTKEYIPSVPPLFIWWVRVCHFVSVKPGIRSGRCGIIFFRRFLFFFFFSPWQHHCFC